jgi:lactate dehydrogenase-like 2-hydroxyacid dehydrogenase
MAKILNLDAVSPNPTRELILKGKTYVIKEMTVEDFITTQKAGEKLDAEKASMARAIEVTVDLILLSIPTMDRSVLGDVPLEQLQAIASFVRGADPVDIVKALEEEAKALRDEKGEDAPVAEGEGEAGKA